MDTLPNEVLGLIISFLTSQNDIFSITEFGNNLTNLTLGPFGGDEPDW